MNFKKSVVVLVVTLALVLPGAALADDMDMMEMKDMTEMTEMKDMKDMTDMTDMNEMDEASMMEMSDIYMGVSTMTKNGIEYVELRQLASKLGLIVEWNARTKLITLTTKDNMTMDMMSKHQIVLAAGVMNVTIDGKRYETMDSPIIIKGRTYVTKSFIELTIAQLQMMK